MRLGSLFAQLVESEERFERRLLDGKRACSPEDCGGIAGYERFVEFLKSGHDPDAEDEEDMKEWIGEWEPEDFDLEETKEGFHW